MLDLTAGTALTESLMVDRCKVTRDTQGPLDDTLNSSLDLVAPLNDVTTIATDLPCIVSQKATRNQGDKEGERQTYRRQWQVSVPKDAPTIKAGDVIEVTATTRDELLGHKVRVFDVTLNSYATRRKMLAEDVVGTARH